ncbi:hypothetical protein HNO53_05120 [Billgrantia antri]|uniref:Uncharacterized protein n=1 Tax=Halomonas sulfidivorans TaxID=2733488 RepID=A0ABX7WGB1_9GAMM|nr:hypothetical protein [Halomonas sulfidivorans]QTP58153.1 hypothetical protein HNO53_05120 [Halomonas sulfidivorans]
MATIVDDHVMVCDDCLMIIGNDDATGLDHFLDEESAAAREREVRDAIAAAQRDGNTLVVGDSEQDEAFSTSSCGCCHTNLAGSRHHCVLMG